MFTVISGKQEHEPTVIQDAQGQQWRLVSAEKSGCVFEAVEHREIGYAPRTLEVAVIVVQKLMGWHKPKDHHLATAPDGFGVVVICDHEAEGYGIAEPIWYKRNDEVVDQWELDRAERIALQGAYTADDFRSTYERRDTFGDDAFVFSARYGYGALI